jgi:ABC-2 type transport system permease protein
MRMLYFASRNQKEILRDPLSSILGILMPVLFILLFSIIAKNAPIEVFKPVNLTPGMTIFGFSFITMFLALLIAKDKSSSFLSRLFISPLTAKDFVSGYILPMFPLVLLQSICCLAVGVLIGVPVSINLLITIISFIPYALFVSFTGVFLGTICNETQVLVVGNIFIQVSALLGGAWMDIKIMGNVFESIANWLPFLHAIEASRAILAGKINNIWIHFAVVCAYAFIFLTLAVFSFHRKMKSDNK